MFLSELELRARKEPGEWVLISPLTWDDGRVSVTVPAGFITDLASIPTGLRWMFDRNGNTRKAAVLHDWLYCSQRFTRGYADGLFLRAMESEGVGFTARHMMYAGVRAGGWRYYGKRKKGLNPFDFER